ncbi:MAG TPA: hypothetical protein DCG48_13795 [Rhodospirillaceae bacterium]|nr:hypothetical protein [Rhodospirillaceae bacterium]
MSEEREHKTEGRRSWLDDPKTVRKIVLALFVLCAGLFFADGFYEKHSHFGAEDVFGFYALYGFVMCVVLVVGAKLMRVFLMRDEDYYDRDR